MKVYKSRNCNQYVPIILKNVFKHLIKKQNKNSSNLLIKKILVESRKLQDMKYFQNFYTCNLIKSLDINMNGSTPEELFVIQNFEMNEQDNDRQLFIYHPNQSKITIHYSPSLIVEVMKNLEKNIIQVIYSNSEIIASLRNSPLSLGYFFELYLKKACLIQNCQINLNIGRNRTESFIFKDTKAYPFSTIPQVNSKNKKITDFSIIQSLDEPIKTLLRKHSNSPPYQRHLFSLLCLPCNQGFKSTTIQIDQTHGQSKHIDFIFLKLREPQSNNSKELKIIQIQAFDASVSQISKQIQDKKKTFLQDFVKFRQNQVQMKKIKYDDIHSEDIKFELKYFIIGNPIQMSSEYKKEDTIFEIGHVPINYLKIFSYLDNFKSTSPEHKQIVFFNQILNLLINISKKQNY